MTKGKAGPGGLATPQDATATSGDVADYHVNLQARHDWDKRLLDGECTLEDALMVSALLGVPLSPVLIFKLEDAFTQQREGKRQLADSFGCARHGNEAQRITAELVRQQAYDLVLELHQRFPKRHVEHLPLTLSSARTKKAGSTAFKRASEILKVPEATVKKLYNAQRKQVTDRVKG